MKHPILCLILLILSYPISTNAQEATSPIIFIYDASGSMWGQIEGKSKMEIAVDVLTTTVNRLPSSQNIGLVAYGHRDRGDCRDVEFLVNADNGQQSEFVQALQSIRPLGMTPLAYSAGMVIEHLKSTSSKATVILVTDGIESCDGNICEVVQTAKDEGVDFRLHIVGFGLKDDETEQLRCATAAGEGTYYDAADAEGLASVINSATSQTIDKGKGNFSVLAVTNGVPIDAWVRAYDVKAKRDPISVRTYSDTAYVYLPPSEYNLEVKPLQGSDVIALEVKGIHVTDDRLVHETVQFDAGKIGVTTTNNGQNWDCLVKVIDVEGKVVASLRSYQEPKEVEINPGLYRVSIQALAIEGIDTFAEIDTVIVRPGGRTELSHNFRSGKIVIDSQVEGKSIDSIVSITEARTGKSVGGGRTYDRGHTFTLNVGTYRVKVAPLGVHRDKKEQTVEIEIKEGDNSKQIITF